MSAAHSLAGDRSTITVVPERGAIVTALRVDGVELLYLDAATLDSPTGAVRGGIPLLFPFAGELAGGRLVATGTQMPRHGFARRKRWDVTDQTDDAMTLRLVQDDETRAEYPFTFDATYTVAALPGGVRVALTIDNRDRAPLPMAPGWHPYFPCPVERTRECLGQLFDVSALRSTPFTCDVNVPAPPGGRIAFDVPGLGTIAIASSSQMRTLEIWTPPGVGFVCVEPWVGASNVINTGDRVNVPPAGRAVFWMEITRDGPRHV
jgi:galactose mutarotase-like enzyme